MCCLIRLISLTAASYFEIVEIESAYLKVLHAHAVAMMCMKGTIRTICTIAHKSCRLWQRIVSFVGIVLPRWARKKKESRTERLKKSTKRKKEVEKHQNVIGKIRRVCVQMMTKVGKFQKGRPFPHEWPRTKNWWRTRSYLKLQKKEPLFFLDW